jgi:hypothetical protein
MSFGDKHVITKDDTILEMAVRGFKGDDNDAIGTSPFGR